MSAEIPNSPAENEPLHNQEHWVVWTTLGFVAGVMLLGPAMAAMGEKSPAIAIASASESVATPDTTNSAMRGLLYLGGALEGTLAGWSLAALTIARKNHQD